MLCQKLATDMTKKLSCDGFNVVQNNGEIAGQTVFHFHIHLIPRYKDDQQNLTWEQHTYEDATMDEIERILMKYKACIIHTEEIISNIRQMQQKRTIC